MQKKTKIIPKFKSYAEEAHFWDTHDITDYFDGITEVEIVIDKNFKSIDLTQEKPTKQETLIVRLQPALKEKLKEFAQQNHLSISGLARVWLIEKLREHTERQDHARNT